jgi:anti-sigma factor RsiW
MTDDLIAYLMDDLSPERRAEVDAKLESDVVWRWELDRLRECMVASGDVAPCSESLPLRLNQLSRLTSTSNRP